MASSTTHGTYLTSNSASDIRPRTNGSNEPHFAYVTLLTTDAFLPGALVLHQSLCNAQSRYPLVVMCPSNKDPLPNDGSAQMKLSERSKDVLRKRGIQLVCVDELSPKQICGDAAKEGWEARFRDTWTKLRVFGLTDYQRVVLLDCDMVVRRNMDDLFEMSLGKDRIAAVHACTCNPRRFKHYPADWIPANCAHSTLTDPASAPITPAPSPLPDASSSHTHTHALLNSGLVVLNPSNSQLSELTDFLATSPLVSNFIFPDQDLLAHVYAGRWEALPWHYNALRPMKWTHVHGEKVWKDGPEGDGLVSCVHYILGGKPWQVKRDEGEVGFKVVDGWWWTTFDQLGDRKSVV